MKGCLLAISSLAIIAQISFASLQNYIIHFPIDDNDRASLNYSRSINELRSIPTDLQQAVNRFSWKIFQNLKLPNSYDNLVLSPILIQILLLALEKGSEGETKSQLQDVVSDVKVQSLLQVISPKGNSRSQLETATGFFVESYTNLNESFRYQSKQLNVDVVPVDFHNEQTTRELINEWASNATHGLIPNLLTDSYELKGLKLALTSAIYFHSSWKYRFSNDGSQIFRIDDKNRRNLNFMKLQQELIYDSISIDGKIKATFLEIPYDNKIHSMVILLPDREYTLDATVKNMRWNHITQIWTMLSSQAPRYLTLKMPKFNITSKTSVVNALLKMGLVDLFTINSKLPYIIPGEELKVSDIIQQAVMKVDEAGTTAAAATAAVLIPLSAGSVEQQTIVIDRPFLAMIFDKSAGVPIFISKIYQP